MALSLGLEGGVARECSDDHIDSVNLAVNLEPWIVVVSGASSPSPSFRRTPEGGFTLQLQQLLAEDFDRGLVVEALARGVIAQLDQPFAAELAELQTTRQHPAQAADRVLATGRSWLLSVGAWWFVFFPTLGLALILLSLNFLADAVVEAIDPHRRHR